MQGTKGEAVVWCPVEITLEVIGGKYKPLLLFYLTEQPVLRFGELRKLVPTASKKMLTQQLRQLEAHGLVNRKVYRQVPPKVEYSLTKRGKSLKPVLAEMGAWGVENARHYGHSFWRKDHLRDALTQATAHRW
jgi:DNA-binding HxlR family transcriptional regulator